jgi:hypothetical protein
MPELWPGSQMAAWSRAIPLIVPVTLIWPGVFEADPYRKAWQGAAKGCVAVPHDWLPLGEKRIVWAWTWAVPPVCPTLAQLTTTVARKVLEVVCPW